MRDNHTALVIVDLSSLDAFTDEHGYANGAELAVQLICAIREHAGLVVVTDQGWELIGSQSDPRRGVLEVLKEHPDVLWFHHDENVSPYASSWRKPMQRLGKLLRARGVTQVALGGVAATEDGRWGCVNETHKHLVEQGFVCCLDKSICGFEEGLAYEIGISF